jgi:lactate dehydrogenase-like 2-hydroxyacid dehydrogenase
MDEKPLVVATRRLPQACERRLEASYNFRRGDDATDFSSDALRDHANGATALIVTPVERLDAATIEALPETIKIMATFSVGYEHIDIEAAKKKGLRVSNTPGVLTAATADLALFLILAATRRAHEGQAFLRSGAWRGIRPTQLLGTQLASKNLGIIGMGRIGSAVAERARAFGMSVVYHNRRPAAPRDIAGDATFVPTLGELLPRCDVLSLHCPLTPETKNILNAERIAQLPDGAAIVNTARGGLVEDDALIAALESGKLSAAGLDVYANEPNLDKRYLGMENVFLLPHLGSATVETRTAMGMLAIDSVDAVLEGREPPHPVV